MWFMGLWVYGFVLMANNRKKVIEEFFDSLAPSRNQWIKKNSFFYNNDHTYTQFLVGEGKRVLELGCGTGQL